MTRKYPENRKYATRIQDKSGKRFGKLSVLRPINKNKQHQWMFECKCDCGNIVLVSSGNLLGAVSCGCYRSHMISKDRQLKTCPKCQKEKDINEFPTNKSRKDNHSKYCKPCKQLIDKHYRGRYKKYRAKYRRDRHKTDPNFRLAANLRSRINSALNKNHKSKKTLELIGCSINTLKLWLDGSFYGEMSWANYGTYWHVDHIKPCILFDLVDINQQKECFHFKNLQALTVFDNQSKGAKYDG